MFGMRIFALTAAAMLLFGCTGGKNENEDNANRDTAMDGGAKAIVVYFSATGNTREVAKRLSSAIGADIYEIKPEKAYTPADLDWHDKKSRSSVEMADTSSRPAMEGGLPDLSGYGTVYVGFPIWWGREPSIIDTFMESAAEALSGKTVVPFATSGSSGMGGSAKNLQKMAPEAKVLDGRRFQTSVSEDELARWAGGF